MGSSDALDELSDGIEDEQTGKARSWVYTAGFAVSLICLSYFIYRAAGLYDDLDGLAEGALTRVPFALVPYLLSYFAAVCAWRYVLKLLGVDAGLSVTAGVFLTAQFGKYIPGNFAHHVGRVTIARRYGLPIPPVIVSMIVEFGVVVGVMTLFSLPVLARYIEPEPIWLMAMGLVGVLVGTAIWSRRRSLLSARAAMTEALASSASSLRWIIPILITAAGAVLSGGSLLLLDAEFAVQLETAVYVVSIFCAAWVAGFFTPGAPAGLGIRELILGEGLAPIVGLESATVVAILLRAVTTIADLLAFGIGLALLHRSPTPKKSPPAPLSW